MGSWNRTAHVLELNTLNIHAVIILSESIKMFGREVDVVDKSWMDIEVITGRWQAQMKGHRIKDKNKLIQRDFVGHKRSSVCIELYYLDVSANTFRGMWGLKNIRTKEIECAVTPRSGTEPKKGSFEVKQQVKLTAYAIYLLHIFVFSYSHPFTIGKCSKKNL